MPALALLLGMLAAQIEPAPRQSPYSTNASGRDCFAVQAAGDARLNSVTFVDAQFGWAVGDRGVIWHTEDGGNHWALQAAPVTAVLQSVAFVDRKNGWAAGYLLHPYRGTGQGVVLATNDGGQHWLQVPGILLPPLHQIHFDTERQGWAVGSSSAMYPAGVFITRDGGRSWMPAGAGSRDSWLTGDFYTSHAAVVAGPLGIAATIQQGEFAHSTLPASGPSIALQNLRSLKLVPPNYGWLIGDGGLISLTADRGRSWRPPLAPLDAATSAIDFHGLAVRGPRAWIVGNPGGRIASTPDAGRTWTTPATGSTLPLNSVYFVDDEHGWAVGDMGQIIATSDGGKSWRIQRAGGDRAALLIFTVDASEIPLELVARTSGGQGYLSVVEVVGRRDLDLTGMDSGQEVAMDERAHQAVVAAGGSAGESAWAFPLQQSGLNLPGKRIVESWDRVHAQQGANDLLAYCVRRIRTWRPTIVVMYAASDGESETQSLLRETIGRAVLAAADPNQFADQMHATGLATWRVSRLCAARDCKSAATSVFASGDRLPNMARSLAEVTLRPRALLRSDFEVGAEFFTVDMLTETFTAPREDDHSGHAGRNEDKGDLGRFIILSAAGARRSAAVSSVQQGGNMQTPEQRVRRWQVLVERLDKDPQALLHALATSDELDRGFDPADAAETLYRLADRLRRSGRWDLAAACYGLLGTRYPDDPLARSALALQIQIEATTSRPSGDFAAVAMVGPQRAIDLGTALEREHPDLFASPDIRFPLAAAYRHLGQSPKAERLYMPDRSRSDREGWGSCARGEYWIATRKGPPPKRMTTSLRTGERPKLDGKLDDPIWQRAQVCHLVSPSGDDSQWPATVMFAHDASYLYVAVQCRQAPGVRYDVAPAGPRPRDPDLSAEDRVDLFLDIDRTYSTYYRLTIDHRGWVDDSFWGDVSWNPKWFVACHTEGGVWIAEAAIPLAELSVTSVSDETIWAVGIQRVVPRVGFQSWTMPAATTVLPQGFGWLGFEK